VQAGSLLGKPAGQSVTVNVADAALPLWRPLAWKLSRRPGIVAPAKSSGTLNMAATRPPVLALAEVNTVAPKVTSTCSEPANPRQTMVTRAPAGPIFGVTAHETVAGLGTVAVVVWVDPAVGRGVVTDEAPEDADAAAWSARWAVQPVPARAATRTVVAMIRTGRMVTPQELRPVSQDSSLG
jgi:hypothetical protein